MNSEVDSLTERTKEMQGGGRRDAKGISLRSRRRRRSVAVPPFLTLRVHRSRARSGRGGERKESSPRNETTKQRRGPTLASYIRRFRGVADRELIIKDIKGGRWTLDPHWLPDSRASLVYL
jgi:hypothetical protein